MREDVRAAVAKFDGFVEGYREELARRGFSTATTRDELHIWQQTALAQRGPVMVIQGREVWDLWELCSVAVAELQDHGGPR